MQGYYSRYYLRISTRLFQIRQLMVTWLKPERLNCLLLISFEFFVVNFSLFFGLIASILMTFIIQRIFAFLNYSQIINMNLLDNADSGFFIRSQNFITQQNTTAGVRS